MEVNCRNVVAIACCAVGAAFLGYCVYFDRKRRSADDFRRRLSERRSESNLKKGKSSTWRPGTPDFPDPEDENALQSFAFSQFRLGKQLMEEGRLEEGMAAIAAAIAAFGDRQQGVLEVLKATFPPNLYKLLVDKIPAIRKKMERSIGDGIKGSKYDARKSDMWSLGVVAYVMLNKRLPYNGAGTSEAMVQRQLERKVSFENKDTSPQYRVAVMALLEPDVIKRFGATAFLNTAWIRMDDRLTPRSKHEKEALTRALGHREKVLGTTVSIPPPMTPISKTLSAGTKRESSGKEGSSSDPLVIRQEQPSSYSSVLRDNTHILEQDSLGLRQHGMSKKKEAVTSKSSTRHGK